MTCEQDVAVLSAELERVRGENRRLRLVNQALAREAASVRPLVQCVKDTRIWDFSPYGIRPDDSWVAIDRLQAAQLLAALARVDHWRPWTTRIDPRPQP